MDVKTSLVTGLLALLLTSCGDSTAEKFTANLGCEASTAMDRLRSTDITMITDSNRAMPAWRASVGPPVVDRAGRSCEQAPIDSLAVVTWNVHVGGANLRRFVSDLRSGKITGKPERHFVMLLQEAYRKGGAVPPRAVGNACPSRQNGEGADITAVADSLGLALFYVPSMRNGCEIRQDRGNAILSTLPLSNLRAIELPMVRQRRVVAAAEIKGHTSNNLEWTVSLASVHLENRGPGNMRDWVHGRAQQARRLVTVLPEASLQVVAGDFNTLRGPSEQAVAIVKSKFANTDLAAKQVTYVSYGLVRSHLDYMFIRSAGMHRSSYKRVPSRYGSDHYPLVGYIHVR